MTDLVQQLKATAIGDMLSAGEAAELVERATLRTLQHDAFLFRSGDSESALHIVLDGSMNVVLGHPEGGTVVAQLGAGQLVGELELMTGSLRVASLRAVDDVSVLELPGDAFNDMLSHTRPVAVKLVTSMAKTLARRLASVNQRLTVKAPAAPEPAPVAVDNADLEPLELSDEDLIPVTIDDEDLEVLDKLWG